MKRQRIRKGIILIAFLLMPAVFYYFSPYLIIMGALEGAATGSMVLFGLLFLFSLVFGRAFCGWVCPMGGLQEGLTLASGKKARGGRRNWIKYFIWVPWLLCVALGAVAAGGIKRLDIFYDTTWGLSVSDVYSLIIYFAVVAFITVLGLTTGKRGFCHYVCWMAPFMVIGTKLRNALGLPGLRVSADSGKCSGCGQCSKRCPMSLDVQEMVKKGDMRNDECILCGECVDGCPRKAVRFSIKAGENKKHSVTTVVK